MPNCWQINNLSPVIGLGLTPRDAAEFKSRALYLAALIFKRPISGFWALSHMVGFVLLRSTLGLCRSVKD